MLRSRRRTPRVLAAAVASGALTLSAAPAASFAVSSGSKPGARTTAERVAPYTTKTPISRGTGGAVTTVDPEATRVGLRVLERGGNAVDAAVAAAAALGVTEPFSAGIGGGGYFVHYNARTGKIRTIDGRETAPESMPRTAFQDGNGATRPFDDLVTSGVSIGVPGTLATWEAAADRWGTRSLAKLLRPAARLAERGFVVDETYALQTEENQPRFEAFTTTPEVFLPGGEVPAVGSLFRNPDLARTYRQIARRGAGWFYGGALGREITAVVQSPPKNPETTLPVPAGYMRPRDLAEYEVIFRKPTRVSYRGYEVYGMRPSSSGGTTVGEALNILETFDLSEMSVVDALHHYLEASALAFADRAEHLGDPAYTPVPVRRLLSQEFADERACELDPDEAATKPVLPGDIRTADGTCDLARGAGAIPRSDTEGRETTNLTVADRWGNVVEYTLTIEATGGSGLAVPGRGFLLNNELTDFSTTWVADDPNRLEGGKRPRSSMSPTIVLRGGEPFLALGSPGGSTIITTVLQTIVNRIDLGMGLRRAVAAPRATQGNVTDVTAEQAFVDRFGGPLGALGHTFVVGEAGTSAEDIGALTAIEFRGRNRLVAAAEPTRRGGGSALVVNDR